MKFVSRRHFVSLGIVALLVVVAAGPGLRYYRYFITHVSTDDAYVDGVVDIIAPRVAGTVDTVYVQDNWMVKAGDLLVSLDQRDFRVRLEQARAQLSRARETVDQQFAQLDAAIAGRQLADSQLREAELDFNRSKALRVSGVISQQYYDQSLTALKVAQANSQLAIQEIARARAALGGDTQDRSRYDRSVVEQAEAALKAAELDLSYTEIRAPVAGLITHKTVHVGHRVLVGEPLMSLVPTNSFYITANFKETQLTYVRDGQKVDVWADIYPDYVYHGHVDSIAAGTGSAFALLPPENATGNWVKVVQRVPVKIVLDEIPPDDKQLRLGLSVEAAIDIRNVRGSLISSLLQWQYQRSGRTQIPTQ